MDGPTGSSAAAESAWSVARAFGAFPAESSSRSCISALAETKFSTRVASAVVVAASPDWPRRTAQRSSAPCLGSFRPGVPAGVLLAGTVGQKAEERALRSCTPPVDRPEASSPCSIDSGIWVCPARFRFGVGGWPGCL